jgi:hypothetical protein
MKNQIKCYGFKSGKTSMHFFLKPIDVVNFIKKERDKIKYNKYDKDNKKIIKQILDFVL